MDRNTTFIGLDVSKETIAVAVAEGGRRGEVRFYGTISSKPEAVAKLVKTLAAKHGRLAFTYEAGPTSYGLYRQLIQLGYVCHVVAPSMTPARPGSQIKTDRRDAVVLASLYRAGELTSIWLPDTEHEAMRDLVRARISAVEAVRRARQQLLSFLLRHGRPYKGRGQHWTKAHRRWLGDQRFDHPAQQIAFEEYNPAIEQAEDRRVRIERQIETLLPGWSLHPVVASIQALRGVSLIAAVTLAAEVGDFHRFTNPRQLMGWLGLVPRERSSGSTPGPRQYHQGWQHARTPHAGGERLDLPVAGTGRGRSPPPQRRSLPGGAGHRLEGAGPSLCALPSHAAVGAAQECRDGRHRARTRRLRLGGRYSDTRTRPSRLSIHSSTRKGTTHNIHAAQRRARRPVRVTLDLIRRATLAPLETEEGPRRTTVLRYPIRVSESDQPSS